MGGGLVVDWMEWVAEEIIVWVPWLRRDLRDEEVVE